MAIIITHITHIETFVHIPNLTLLNSLDGVDILGVANSNPLPDQIHIVTFQLIVKHVGGGLYINDLSQSITKTVFFGD